ncbi:pyridoxamine 5'-phosphate oxidase family protein [Mycolicibacterium sp. CBMA 226]|uniref:pyridoxamine 5'-phosphate oxidase family protein n=1 Tax=Mycolicibacterium sp. CBMA 226 TaxID=2606611 RepID=UPI0012DED627|nr:pyridoxamine 5'-phosphate oxidase family protein [Mycolicibacterium sp. CBMA 226]MUL79088.1 pyridoxamine 5'-phosphate oxidase family protein [Mycolicibacterium sp. CBMA 226]
MTAYHAGELEVQRRMGQADIAVRVGRIIRTEIPAAAAAFLAEQPMSVLSATDDAGRVWASLVTGPAGFVHADADGTIMVGALPVPGDPLHDVVRRPGQQVGMIAIEPQTRRRMRVNGIAQPTEVGLRIQPDQVYSNCPKYISRRHINNVAEVTHRPAVHRADLLDARTQQIIARTDTFFVGSADPDGNADASHRGGNPGFLQVLSPNRLRWPDYRGNSMFMTLGNISANPRCGLLIPDWETGTTLQLTGTAEIIWDGGPGSQCSVEFTVDEVIELTDVSPLRWGQAELSPANPG